MTPKPLTKERRAEIVQYDCIECGLADVVQELLAAEAYWREAVKSAAPEKVAGMYECHFCGGAGMPEDKISHSIGCPWWLTQEVRLSWASFLRIHTKGGT